MKYLIIIGLALFMVLGCITSGVSGSVLRQTLTERYFDGCRYITNGTGITHKGNCSNPIHTKGP